MLNAPRMIFEDTSNMGASADLPFTPSSIFVNQGQTTGIQESYLMTLEQMLKDFILANPEARVPYQLIFRLVWEAESKILF